MTYPGESKDVLPPGGHRGAGRGDFDRHQAKARGAIGGGYLRQVTHVGTGQFSSGEGTVSGGMGVRLELGERVFLASEIRVGYEPELRFGVTVGVRPRR